VIDRSPPIAGLKVTPTLFECVANRVGAIECPSHGSSTDFGGPPPPRHPNATLHRGGQLTLDHPPTTRLRNVWPNWMKLRPLLDGYVVPFNSAGKLRTGLLVRRGEGYNVAAVEGCAKYSEGLLICTATTVCFRHPKSTFLLCPKGSRGTREYYEATEMP
jgi:hypothetical protein